MVLIERCWLYRLVTFPRALRTLEKRSISAADFSAFLGAHQLEARIPPKRMRIRHAERVPKNG
jgi:hypothetical protein